MSEPSLRSAGVEFGYGSPLRGQPREEGSRFDLCPPRPQRPVAQRAADPEEPELADAGAGTGGEPDLDDLERQVWPPACGGPVVGPCDADRLRLDHLGDGQPACRIRRHGRIAGGLLAVRDRPPLALNPASLSGRSSFVIAIRIRFWGSSVRRPGPRLHAIAEAPAGALSAPIG